MVCVSSSRSRTCEARPTWLAALGYDCSARPLLALVVLTDEIHIQLRAQPWLVRNRHYALDQNWRVAEDVPGNAVENVEPFHEQCVGIAARRWMWICSIACGANFRFEACVIAPTFSISVIPPTRVPPPAQCQPLPRAQGHGSVARIFVVSGCEWNVGPLTETAEPWNVVREHRLLESHLCRSPARSWRTGWRLPRPNSYWRR